MKFNESNYDDFLIELDVIGFFEKPITLKSGRISNWYANCRNLQDTVGAIDKVSGFVLDFVEDQRIEFDYFYGVPDGITKLGTILNYKKGKNDDNVGMPLVIGRKTPKPHGAAKDKYFIGPVKEGDKVIILEDVTTTGGSMIESIEQLREAGVEIVAALGLVNRGEKRDDGKSVFEKVKEFGFPYYNLSDAYRLLPKVAKKQSIGKDVKIELIGYFDKYGIKKLTL